MCYFGSWMKHILMQYGCEKFWKTKENLREDSGKHWKPLENSGKHIGNFLNTQEKILGNFQKLGKAVENIGKLWKTR